MGEEVVLEIGVRTCGCWVWIIVIIIAWGRVGIRTGADEVHLPRVVRVSELLVFVSVGAHLYHFGDEPDQGVARHVFSREVFFGQVDICCVTWNHQIVLVQE